MTIRPPEAVRAEDRLEGRSRAKERSQQGSFIATLHYVIRILEVSTRGREVFRSSLSKLEYLGLYLSDFPMEVLQ